jgi:hypothetical protein
MQIAVTGAIALLVLHVVMHMIGKCPRMWIAVPILGAYFSGWAAMVGGFLWWVWA